MVSHYYNIDNCCNETADENTYDEIADDKNNYFKIKDELRRRETADEGCYHEIADQIFMSPKQSINFKEKNTKEQILPEYLVSKSIHYNFYNKSETNALFRPIVDANVSYVFT